MLEDGIIVFVIVMGIFLLFAVISNAFVIMSVTCFKKLRSVTNVLIGNLAVADLLLGGLYMPQKLHDLTHTDNYYEGAALCKLINFIPIFLITSSCYTLVCIAFERRRAIVWSHKQQMTFSHTRKVIASIWIFSFVISFPMFFEYSVDTFYVEIDDNVTHIHLLCGHTKMSYTFVLTNGIFVLIVSFLIPLVLVFYNYAQLAIFINKKGRMICNDASLVPTISGNLNNRQRPYLHKHRIKIVKMLVLVAAMFALSWVPFFALYMYMKITGKDASKDAGSVTGLLHITMATFSTAYNAMLYVIFNHKFREAFRSIMKCSWKENPGSRIPVP